MAHRDGSQPLKAIFKSPLLFGGAFLCVFAVLVFSGCGKPDVAAEHARLKVDPAIYAHFKSLIEFFKSDQRQRAALFDNEVAWLKQRADKCGSGSAFDIDCAAKEDKARLKQLQVKRFLVLLHSAPAAVATVTHDSEPSLPPNLPFSPIDVISSPQGDSLAIAGSDTLAIIDTSDGRLRWTDNLDRCCDDVAYSPNGRIVMAANTEHHNQPARFYDVTSGERLLAVRTAAMPAWIGRDGRYLAQVAGDRGDRLVVRDVTTGEDVGGVSAKSGDASEPLSAVAVDEQGTRLATFSHGVVTLYQIVRSNSGNVSTIQLRRIARNANRATHGKYQYASKMLFSRDGGRLFVITPYNTTILNYSVPVLELGDVLELKTAGLPTTPIVTPVPYRSEVVITAYIRDNPADYPKAFVLNLDTKRCYPLPGSAELPYQGTFQATPVGNTGVMAYLNGNRIWTAPEPKSDQLRAFSSDVLMGPKLQISGDYQVQAVGVDTGVQPKGTSAIVGESTVVQVNVSTTDRPVVLVLASHESVVWLVDAPGDNVRQVLLSGQGRSHAFGLKNVRQTNIGPAWAYAPGTADYRKLEAEVEKRLGHGIDQFEGQRSSGIFFVGDGASAKERSARTAADGGTRWQSGSAQSENLAHLQNLTAETGRPPDEAAANTTELKAGIEATPAATPDRSTYHYELVMTRALKAMKPVDNLSRITISPQQTDVYFVTRLTGLQSSNADKETIPVRTRIMDAASKVIFDSTTSIARNSNTASAYFWALVYPNTQQDAPGDWTIQVTADGKPLYEEKRKVQF